MKRIIVFVSFLFSCILVSADSGEIKFTFETLVSMARNSARCEYKERVTPLPKSLQNLDYSQYNLMRYNIDSDLWANDDLPFRVSFFPLGTTLYSLPVEIYEIDNETLISKVPFSPKFFQYEDQVKFIKDQMPEDAGYAGFKLRYKPKGSSYPDEFAAFLGNSYFRIICDGSSYGLSNRGLAINTGVENVPEEFPAFEKFYLVKPSKGDESIIIYAFLNGRSVTGAYSFKITPGTEASVDVKSVLFLRNKVNLLCLAPITSMFWFTLGEPDNFYDYRPSVHNSEGLVLSDGKNDIYEPLTNYPFHKMINDDISCDSLRYFGLVQRDREYNRYMDPGVKYHLNPNCLIVPQNNWREGSLRLFVLPTLTEWMDNINLFWIPKTLPEPMEPINFDYKILYSLKEPKNTLSFVKYTNLGQDLINCKNTIFALSFADKDAIIEKSKDIKIDLQVPSDVIIASPPSIEKIIFNDTWRVLFTLTIHKKLAYEDKPFIIKCTLKDNGKSISEEWYFLWYPQ